MKLLPLFVTVAWCAPAASVVEAQPWPNKVTLIDIHTENKDVTEAVSSIAAQGKIVVLVGWDVAGKVDLFDVTQVTPEVALEKLAKAANLKLTQRGAKSYFLETIPPGETAATIEQAMRHGVTGRLP
jgi:hypothetical protein